MPPEFRRRFSTSRLPAPTSAAAVALLLFGVAALGAVGCADTADSPSETDRFEEGTSTRVDDPLRYDTDASVDVQGETSIRDLLDTPFPGSGDPEPIWFGYAPDSPYPQGTERSHGEICEPNFGNTVYEVDDLPTTITGVVTIFPQYYDKVGVCAQDHRFYGNYYLQDSTGSVLILKDSRIADFTVGDRVSLRVRGIVKRFGTVAVSAWDRREIVSRADEEDLSAPVEVLEDQSFAQRFERDSGDWSGGSSESNCWDLDNGFQVPPGFGNSFRVSGRVCQEPTNTNFSNITIHGGVDSCSEEPDVTWSASLGLELGRRATDISRGDEITMTGPVVGQLVGLVPCEWTFRMTATRMGQIGKFNE